LAEAVEGVTVFGDPVDRLPHIVCLGIEGVEAEPVLLGLDQAGIAVHSGSSCSSETLEPSPVLRPWASTPSGRCASRSGGRPPTPTSSLRCRVRRVVAELRALRS
jgi:hypothetical protein